MTDSEKLVWKKHFCVATRRLGIFLAVVGLWEVMNWVDASWQGYETYSRLHTWVFTGLLGTFIWARLRNVEQKPGFGTGRLAETDVR